MRRFAMMGLAAALGCSAEIGPNGAGGDASLEAIDANDANEGRAEDALVEVSVDASRCGVVACDEAKTHHVRIQEAWERLGGEPNVGIPADAGAGVYVHRWGAGLIQDFSGGSLGAVALTAADATAEWSKTGWAVRGRIRETWLALGGGPGFGYPKEDEHDGPGGKVQTFEKGCLGPDGAGGYASFTACEAPPDMTGVLEAIRTKAVASAPGTDFGIAVEWLPTGQRWGVRADVARNSASSAKFIWAMAALSKNSTATVETPALPTFADSNNTTAGQLIDLAGGPNAVNDFTSKALGIPTAELSLCHWSYDKTRNATNCSNALGGENFFTPNGAVKFLEAAWQRKSIGAAKGDKLLDWAKRSPRSGYGGWIGTQLPASVRPDVHHKAGWLPSNCCGAGFPAHYNDIGIVPTPRGSYAVVLSMKGGTDAKMTKTMEWSSCVLWHAFAKDVADPLTACTGP